MTSLRIGFHAVPSMSQLHLHLISTDFLGSGLKNKKHYNSFTTPFLVPIDDAIDMLSNEGRIKVLIFITNPFWCSL
jgi:aprataxin